MPVRLFVGNLPYNVTEAELREHFSAAGSVSYLSLPTDRETGRVRGFAFIEFIDAAEAEEAIRRFNNQSFNGRPISVSIARAKEDRPPADRSNRPTTTRPTVPRLGLNEESDVGRSLEPGNKPGRDFGPDASSQAQRNKKKNTPRPERGPKGPMREKVRGQFFGGDDDYDDDYDDDLDEDVDDFYEDEDELPDDEDDHYKEELEKGTKKEILTSPLMDLIGGDNK